MVEGILSVKMREMESQMDLLRKRIRICEAAPSDRIREEADELRRECMQEAVFLQNRLQHTKAAVSCGLAESYREMEQVIGRAQEKIKKFAVIPEDTEEIAERKILLAEYALDFAMQAADHALLAAFDARKAQLSCQEKEKEKRV